MRDTRASSPRGPKGVPASRIGHNDPMRTPPPIPAEFEPEFITGLKAIFEEKIVFNQVLGLKITSLLPERVTCLLYTSPSPRD